MRNHCQTSRPSSTVVMHLPVSTACTMRIDHEVAQSLTIPLPSSFSIYPLPPPFSPHIYPYPAIPPPGTARSGPFS